MRESKLIMKKILFVFAAASLLVACGEKEEKEEGTENKSTEKVTEHEHDHDHHEEHEHQSLEGGTTIFEESEWETYGQNPSFDATQNISVDSLFKIATNGPAEGLVVKGNIAEVCQKAGCWITMNTSDDQEMFIRFKDHFTVPIPGQQGKTVYVHGNVTIDTTTIAMQKHYLTDRVEMGEEVPQEEFDAITEDKIQPMFIADGIWIEKK